MRYLLHFLLLDVFIVLAEAIGDAQLPVKKFRDGMELDYSIDKSKDIALGTTFRIVGSDAQSEIDTVQVHSNGLIDLKKIGAYIFQISVYDGGPISGGEVFYHQVTDPSKLMSDLPNLYKDSVESRIGSTPNFAFVVTWSKIEFPSSSNQVNTYQLVLLSNNTHTSVLLAYVAPIFLASASNNPKASFEFKGDVYYLPGSRTKAVVNLAKDSNFLTSDETGLWLYDLGKIGNIKEAENNFKAPCTEQPLVTSQQCNNDLECKSVQGKGFGRCMCPDGKVLVDDTKNLCQEPESTTRSEPKPTTTENPQTESITRIQPKSTTTVSNNDNDETLYFIIIACACGVVILTCGFFAIRKLCKRRRGQHTTTTSGTSQENGSSNEPSSKSTGSGKGFKGIMDMLVRKDKISDVGSSVDSEETQSRGGSSYRAGTASNTATSSTCTSGAGSSNHRTSSVGTSSSGGSS